MADEAPRKKILFVLSNDHGELFNAMYFSLGTPFECVFLLPPKLFAVNEKAFPYLGYRYESVAEIEQIVAHENPDVIMLFSGYLFVINRILDMKSLAGMIGRFREQGRRIATSDPSVGLMAQVDDTTFDPLHPARDFLKRHCQELAKLLGDMTHIYLTPDVETPMKHVSFFNPNMDLAPDVLARADQRVREWEHSNPDKARWLFVLSPEDYQVQIAKLGSRELLDRLFEVLRAAVTAGRQPFLVGPAVFIAELRARDESIEDLVALSACNYTFFMQLIYTSEYAFYWNRFSASLLARMVNRAPFFVLDDGHVTHFMPRFLEVGEKNFYRDVSIDMVQPGDDLSAEHLGKLAEVQRQGVLQNASLYYRTSPRPEDILHLL